MQFIKRLIELFLIGMLVGCVSSGSKDFGARQVVTIDSIPSGAEIFFNGKMLGITPTELSLQRDTVHEVHFKKEGFKPKVGYLNPVLKNNEKQFIQFGMAKDLGYYYRLTPSQLTVELEWEALPDTPGIVPFERMGILTEKADEMKRSGDLSEAEHKIVIRQIIKLFE